MEAKPKRHVPPDRENRYDGPSFVGCRCSVSVSEGAKTVSDLIISVSGLRGIVGSSLTPDVAIRYVAAYATQLPPGPLVVARDGRDSGSMLRDAVASALAACGREVVDLGVAATPTVGYYIKASKAVGGIQISASHNPPPYNGIKLFGADGRVIGAAAGSKVREAYLASTANWQPHHALGQVSRCGDPHVEHLEAVLSTVNVDAIRQRHFRVLLDSNHGSGGLLGLRLLEELGCEVIACGAVADGKFAHPPEPTAENLQGIAERLTQLHCDIGFCQDPDADRLALIDAEGKYIGEEYTVALCVMHRLQQQPGPIVINCATSSMSQWLAEQAGVDCYRSAVGEANVADRMIAVAAIYGGEGNGGPIDPRIGYVRDSFVGMAQVLDLMTASGKTLAELAASLPHFAIHKDKATVSGDKLPAVFEALEKQFAEADSDRSDGLRLAWQDRWLLVRGSNTEPIVRLIAEAPTIEQAQQMCGQAATVINAIA